MWSVGSSAKRRSRARLDDFSPAVVQRALILQWAAAQGIATTQLAQSTAVAQLLDRDVAPVPPALATLLQHTLPTCTLKQVEQVLEDQIGRAKRQSHGTVYTPEYIIDELVGYALGEGWHTPARLPRLCDPACGAGGFLLRAAHILHHQYHFALPQIFAEALVGIDVDPAALVHARILIDLYLLQHGVRPDAVRVNLVHADTLLTPQAELLARGDAPAGFDVVVTNPPYVKLQNLALDYRDALLAEYAEFARGSFSMALLFLVRCHTLLTPQGCAGLITQNNLFTSFAGRGVREYLQRTGSVRRIVDFGHHKVFANASAYTCLIWLGRQPRVEFAYAAGVAQTVASGDSSGRALQALPTVPIRVAELEATKWRLAAAHHLANVRRIESAGVPLGDLVAIRVGFATLKDAVFVLPTPVGVGADAAADDSADKHIGVTVDGVTYDVEWAITRPARRIPDLRGGNGNDAARWRVIFPYQRVDGRYVLLAEAELAARYPEAYRYLLAHQAALLDRDKRRKAYAGWYAWGRTQGMDARGPKLLTRTFSQRPAFMLDISDALYCNGYGLFPRPGRMDATLPSSSLPSSSLPLAALARVLNSRVMHYYAKLTSFQIDGDFQCYQKNFIECFGVPRLTAPEVAAMLALPDADFEAWLTARYGLDAAAMTEVIGTK